MSWSPDINGLPNWQGNNKPVGKLYISTSSIPYIGLSNRNLVQFPSTFSTLSFSTLEVGGVVVTSNSFGGDVSQWANYPAVSNIDANGRDIANAKNVYISGELKVEGNPTAPYWNAIKLDGNITTANQTTNKAPTAKQYVSQYNLYNTSFDAQSILNNFAFQNAHLQLTTGGVILPTGDVTLESKNYKLLYPSTSPPFYGSGTYRGRLYLGTNGSGPEAYIRFNYDTLGSLIPDQAALIEINADSVLGVTTLAPSRIRLTSGKVDGLGTYQNDQTAGTRLTTYPSYNATCLKKQYAYGGTTAIPDPTTGNAGQIDIICSGDNNISPIGDTFGNSVVNIQATRNTTNTFNYQATVNIKANDKVNVNSYRTQIDSYELRLGTIGGTGIKIVCDGGTEFQSPANFKDQVDMSNLNSASGAYPASISNSFINIYKQLSSFSSMMVVSSSLVSSVMGLGTIGYVSSSQLTSTVRGLTFQGLVPADLTSSIAGLGTVGYISSPQLLSSISGIQSFLQPNITSTINGLGNIGYLSSVSLTSTVRGLGNIYISTQSLNSTVTGIFGFSGNSLVSTTSGLGNIYISTQSLNSTVTGIFGFSGNSLVSTTSGLGNIYISTPSLTSTVTSLLGNSGISIQALTSTTTGLGNIYISTPSLTSTVTSLLGNSGLSIQALTSTTTGLGNIYVSTLVNISTINISSASITTSSINSVPIINYNNANWSSNPATTFLEMSFNNISNVVRINNYLVNGDLYNSNWSVFPCLGGGQLAMNNRPISNASYVQAQGVSTLGVSTSSVLATNIFTTSLTQPQGNAIIVNDHIDMANNNLSNLGLINGRTLFGWGELYSGATRTITANALTAVPWTGLTYSGCNVTYNGTTTSRLGLNVGGTWRLCANLPLTKTTPTIVIPDIFFRINGATQLTNSASHCSVTSSLTTWVSCEAFYQAAALDYVELMVGTTEALTIPYRANITTPYVAPARNAKLNAYLMF